MICRILHAETSPTVTVARRASAAGTRSTGFGYDSTGTATGSGEKFHRHMNRPAARGGPS